MVDLDLMDLKALDRLQSPKKQYREIPATTVIILKAQGHLGEGISSKVETGKKAGRTWTPKQLPQDR